jgi:hypothetical protein
MRGCLFCGLQANASELVGRRLTLLLDEDLDEVQANAERLKVLLPNITVDKFVEWYPQVLDIDDFELALQVRHRSTRGARLAQPPSFIVCC